MLQSFPPHVYICSSVHIHVHPVIYKIGLAWANKALHLLCLCWWHHVTRAVLWLIKLETSVGLRPITFGALIYFITKWGEWVQSLHLLKMKCDEVFCCGLRDSQLEALVPRWLFWEVHFACMACGSSGSTVSTLTPTGKTEAVHSTQMRAITTIVLDQLWSREPRLIFGSIEHGLLSNCSMHGTVGHF